LNPRSVFWHATLSWDQLRALAVHYGVLDLPVRQIDQSVDIQRLHVLGALLAPVELIFVIIAHFLSQKRLLAAFDHLLDVELLPEVFRANVEGLISRELLHFLLRLRDGNRFRGRIPGRLLLLKRLVFF